MYHVMYCSIITPHACLVQRVYIFLVVHLLIVYAHKCKGWQTNPIEGWLDTPPSLDEIQIINLFVMHSIYC